MRLDVTLVVVRSLGRPYSEGARALRPALPRSADPLLPQATYRIGGHDIFIVPVARTTEGTDYEAIFT